MCHATRPGECQNECGEEEMIVYWHAAITAEHMPPGVAGEDDATTSPTQLGSRKNTRHIECLQPAVIIGV